MKTLWLPLATVLLLAACTPDRTLESLVPRNAMAVVLVEHPAAAALALGTASQDLPWKSLNQNKPWAAAALPGTPPGFLLALALADQAPDQAWSGVQAWAVERGGLAAARRGNYAVLTSPGLDATSLDPGERFDLTRVRSSGDGLVLYIDVKNILAGTTLPSSLRLGGPLLPWVERNLAGIRVGFAARDGGVAVRLATDWVSEAAPAVFMRNQGPPADLALWTGRLPSVGLGVALSLPETARYALGDLVNDSGLSKRWAALVPHLGPRVAVSAVPRADGSWAWAAAIESQDPQAVRQAVKTLVAGGELQKHFAAWALDTDTPLIYQDRPEAAGGVRTELTLGSSEVHMGYGADRVALTGGAGALEALTSWTRPSAAAAPWFRETPSGSSVVATGSLEGLSARGAVKILGDGNIELRFWVDAAGLRAWEEKLPQAAMGWASALGR